MTPIPVERKQDEGGQAEGATSELTVVNLTPCVEAGCEAGAHRCQPEQHDNCARCGSSLHWERCEMCPGFGYYGDADPDCASCGGTGNVPYCLSPYEWCEANPLPGRGSVERHTVEWVTCYPDGTSTSTMGGLSRG